MNDLSQKLIDLEKKIGLIEKNLISKQDLYEKLTDERVQLLVRYSIMKRIIENKWVKGLTFIAIGFLVLGIVIWGVADFKNGVEIKNIKEQSNLTKIEISKAKDDVLNYRDDIRDLKTTIENNFNDKTSDITLLERQLKEKFNAANDTINKILMTYQSTWGGIGLQTLDSLERDIKEEITFRRNELTYAKVLSGWKSIVIYILLGIIVILLATIIIKKN